MAERIDGKEIAAQVIASVKDGTARLSREKAVRRTNDASDSWNLRTVNGLYVNQLSIWMARLSRGRRQGTPRRYDVRTASPYGTASGLAPWSPEAGCWLRARGTPAALRPT